MGDVNDAPALTPEAIEQRLSWGSILRGVRLGAGADRALLLHESSRDIDAWRSLPRLIAVSLAVEVVALDLPGHGLSDGPWQPNRLHALIREVLLTMPATRFVIAAGATALAALQLAADQDLAGLISLSPDAPHHGSGLARSPRVPKLFFAGSAAGDDLETARRLASSGGGWAVVTSLPVGERGTGLLTTEWGGRIGEETAAFLRDCRRRRRPGAAGNGRPADEAQSR